MIFTGKQKARSEGGKEGEPYREINKKQTTVKKEDKKKE